MNRHLLEVTQVQGEVENGVLIGNLEKFLKDYGEKGRDEILDTLDFLKKEVCRYFDKWDKRKR